MSVILVCPQKEQKETSSDFIMRLAHTAYRGKDQERGLAKLTLMLMALEELDDPNPSDERNYVKGVKRGLAVYNLSESVFRDLELNPYGESPSLVNRFSVMDSFAVFGKLKPSNFYAGAILDFFQDKPSKTTTFAQYTSRKSVRELASEVFGFKNVNGKPAYIGKGFSNERIDLEKYGEPKNINAIVARGEILFRRSRTQNEVTKGLMNLVSQYDDFSPEIYALMTYDFEIDFPIDGSEKFHKGFDKVIKRVYSTFEVKKAA